MLYPLCTRIYVLAVLFFSTVIVSQICLSHEQYYADLILTTNIGPRFLTTRLVPDSEDIQLGFTLEPIVIYQVQYKLRIFRPQLNDHESIRIELIDESNYPVNTIVITADRKEQYYTIQLHQNEDSHNETFRVSYEESLPLRIIRENSDEKVTLVDIGLALDVLLSQSLNDENAGQLLRTIPKRNTTSGLLANNFFAMLVSTLPHGIVFPQRARILNISDQRHQHNVLKVPAMTYDNMPDLGFIVGPIFIKGSGSKQISYEGRSVYGDYFVMHIYRPNEHRISAVIKRMSKTTVESSARARVLSADSALTLNISFKEACTITNGTEEFLYKIDCSNLLSPDMTLFNAPLDDDSMASLFLAFMNAIREAMPSLNGFHLASGLGGIQHAMKKRTARYLSPVPTLPENTLILPGWREREIVIGYKRSCLWKQSIRTYQIQSLQNRIMGMVIKPVYTKSPEGKDRWMMLHFRVHPTITSRLIVTMSHINKNDSQDTILEDTSRHALFAGKIAGTTMLNMKCSSDTLNLTIDSPQRTLKQSGSIDWQDDDFFHFNSSHSEGYLPAVGEIINLLTEVESGALTILPESRLPSLIIRSHHAVPHTYPSETARNFTTVPHRRGFLRRNIGWAGRKGCQLVGSCSNVIIRPIKGVTRYACHHPLQTLQLAFVTHVAIQYGWPHMNSLSHRYKDTLSPDLLLGPLGSLKNYK